MSYFRRLWNGGYRAQIALGWELAESYPMFFSDPDGADHENLIAGSWNERTHHSGGRDGKRRKALDRARRKARKSRGKS